MIKNLKFKGQLRQYLIGLNIALSIVLFILILFWLFSVRPGQIEKATYQGHYMSFMMDNLPSKYDDDIKVDYIGEHQIAEAEPEQDISEIEKKSVELIEKVNKLLPTDENTSDLASLQEKKAEIKKQPKDQPKLSIIVTNLGLNRRSAELALTLPKECALGFLPYTKSLQPLLHKAQSNGYEIYLYLPLQTNGPFNNPGKYALMTNLGSEENIARLNVILNSHAKYNGVYTSYKEVFTDNIKASKIIFDYLHDKNLIFILGKKDVMKPITNNSKAYDNIFPINIIIDEEPDKEFIKKQLEELIKIAQNNGIALGYAQGFTLTIEMIREWTPTLKKLGIKLVPVSELLKEYRA